MYMYYTLVLCHNILVHGIRFLIVSQTSSLNPRCGQKYPDPITPNILSMDALDGKVQLNIVNCLFRRSGISFLPPPGCIMAARN